jgi:acetoin utilization deacetylase AcuC-like enzyme
MKVVFHDLFLNIYAGDPAATPHRLDHSLALVKGKYPLIEPSPCSDEDVLLVHLPTHLQHVKKDEDVYRMALLAAGSTIKASEMAMAGKNAFALCRPPGHHAGPNRCWGFCYFNNVAIAVQRLLEQGEIKRALIVDFDLHFGDGTDNIFAGKHNVDYYHISGEDNITFINNLKEYLQDAEADLVAVSAGFDRHRQDWGRMLSTEDYGTIGEILGSFAREKCSGRLFAALEGGYNSRSLGEAIIAFLDGLSV